MAEENAMDLARAALARIEKNDARMEKHEIKCDGRHKQIADSQATAAIDRKKMHFETGKAFIAVNGRIDRLYNRSWLVMGALVTFLCGACGWLLAEKLGGQ